MQSGGAHVGISDVLYILNTGRLQPAVDKRRGAWAFNAAQVSVAAAMVNDIRVLLYAVPLLAAGQRQGGRSDGWPRSFA